MINILNTNKTSTTPIFVIGTGRSGTHLLGRTFYSNPETKVMIEKPEFFNPVTKLAIGMKGEKKGIESIIKLYNKLFLNTKEVFLLEKTHPNIWFVEELLEAFPTAKFIGIHRNVYATVSSMLNHSGVLNWYKVLPQDQVNSFLGITEENKDSFDNLPLESKCALRWKSHTERLYLLNNKFPKSVLLIDYDEFFFNYDDLIDKIKKFIGISSNLNSEKLNPESLQKWKSFLSEEQINNIDNVLEK